MLAGEAVVAIWNNIHPDARDQFHDWHINEHMPERVGIPGFRRGRRYIAADPAPELSTHPEFFTLYEADTMQVLLGTDYANRLNDPTPATKAVTAAFRDRHRSLARVEVSHGPGMGGALLTIRFTCDASHRLAVRALVRAAAQATRMTGAHLCLEDRGDAGFILAEALDPEALTDILLDRALLGAGVTPPFVRGLYRLEYVRMKTGFAS